MNIDAPFHNEIARVWTWTLHFTMKWYIYEHRRSISQWNSTSTNIDAPFRNEIVHLLKRSVTAEATFQIRDDATKLQSMLSDYRKRIIQDIQTKHLNIESMTVFLNLVQESQELLSALRHTLRGENKFVPRWCLMERWKILLSCSVLADSKMDKGSPCGEPLSWIYYLFLWQITIKLNYARRGMRLRCQNVLFMTAKIANTW